MTGRRGRPRKLSEAELQVLAELLPLFLNRGEHLYRSHGMGWLLRRLEPWPDALSPDGRKMVWVDVDETPEEQLGALLRRHQERQRSHR